MGNEVDNQNLKNLEKYLASLQNLEMNIESDNSQIDKIIDKRSSYESFFLGVLLAGEIYQQELLVKELENWLNELLLKAGGRGKVMSNEAIKRFLDKTERVYLRKTALSKINRMSDLQALKRYNLYKKQLMNETSKMRNEIEEFFLAADAAGRSKKQALREIIRATHDRAGPVEGFRKRTKAILIQSARREASEQSITEYLKVSEPKELWRWIAISSRPCPDCSARAGVTLVIDKWRTMGLPGEGRTICGRWCKCQLVPITISDELFGDYHEFNWDKENLILTTNKEAKIFKAESNRKKPSEKVKVL